MAPCKLGAMGLLMPELRGLPESGDMLMGDVCEMGDMSALTGVPPPHSWKSRLEAFELSAEIVLPAVQTTDGQVNSRNEE